jgi:radical SAM protein with 4Fe4S-binding SPASM domain
MPQPQYKKKINLSQVLPLSHPLSIHIELTNKCNFKCFYCPTSLDDFEEKSGGLYFLSPNQFEKIIDQILDVGGCNVLKLWIMGEPLLNKNIFKYIQHAKQILNQTKIEITTNGSVLNNENGIKLINSGVDNVIISLHGIDDLFNKTSNSKLKYEKIKKNIFDFNKNLEKSIKKVFCSIRLIQQKNIDELVKFKEQFGKLEFMNLIYDIPHNWKDDTNEFYDLVDGSNIEILNKKKQNKDVCPFPFYTLAVHGNGEMSMCCIDWDKKTSIGNCLTNTTIKEAWNSSRADKFRYLHLNREAHKNEACNKCDYFKYYTSDNLDGVDRKLFETN